VLYQEHSKQVGSMKLFLSFTSVVLFSILSATCWAEDADFPVETFSTTTATVAKAPSKSNYLLGARTVYFDYQEGDFMNDKGFLTGLAGGYFYQFMDNGLFRADGEFLQGGTKYNGGLQDSSGHTTPYQSEDKFRVMNFSGIAMFSSSMTESFVTAPFLGLGYRNTLDGKDNKYDYTRDITYYYLIYGAQFEFINDSRTLFLMNLELDTLLGGQALTKLSDVDSSYPDMNLEFKSGSAYKIGFEFYYTLPTAGKLMAELSYKKWQVAQSKPVAFGDGYFVEPANTTALTSMTLGYLF
jgi:hypothetical protein